MKSDNIKKGIQRAPHRSLLRACGLGDNDFDKPFIGIANSFTEIVPGHIHLRELVEFVKEGIIAAGGIPFEFNTMAICDGISMNHEGMKYSLPSRENSISNDKHTGTGLEKGRKTARRQGSQIVEVCHGEVLEAKLRGFETEGKKSQSQVGGVYP